MAVTAELEVLQDAGGFPSSLLVLRSSASQPRLRAKPLDVIRDPSHQLYTRLTALSAAGAGEQQVTSSAGGVSVAP